jgi:hypothetical protein
MDNIARLCHHHHQLKTHKGYRLIGGPGHWQFLAPAQPRQTKPKRRRTNTNTARPPDDPGPRLFTDRE